MIVLYTRCETHDLAPAVTATANAGSRIEDPGRSHVRCSIHPAAQADAAMAQPPMMGRKEINNMMLSDLCIDVHATMGKNFKLIEVNPVYKYENGKVTNEVQAYKYNVVLEDKRYKQVSVKVFGEQRIATPQFPVSVNFVGLEIRAYDINGKFAVSVTAKDIKVVDSTKG